jgi:hypothetical protein
MVVDRCCMHLMMAESRTRCGKPAVQFWRDASPDLGEKVRVWGYCKACSYMRGHNSNWIEISEAEALVTEVQES